MAPHRRPGPARTGRLGPGPLDSLERLDRPHPQACGPPRPLGALRSSTWTMQDGSGGPGILGRVYRLGRDQYKPLRRLLHCVTALRVYCSLRRLLFL